MGGAPSEDGSPLEAGGGVRCDWRCVRHEKDGSASLLHGAVWRRKPAIPARWPVIRVSLVTASGCPLRFTEGTQEKLRAVYEGATSQGLPEASKMAGSVNA